MGIIGKEKRANEKLKASYYEKIVELIPIGLNSFGYMVSLYVILITQGVFQKKKKYSRSLSKVFISSNKWYQSQ